MSSSDVTGELLRASVGIEPDSRRVDDIVRGAAPGSLAGLAEAARFHGISGYVHQLVRSSEAVPSDVLDALAAARTLSIMDHLRKLADVRWLSSCFADEDVDWLVVKGPTLVELAHGRPELRSYSDLDVLVDPRQLGRVLQLLEAKGCRVTDQNWTLINAEMKGEVHLTLPTGTALDLHWHLLNTPARRRAFPLRTRTLLDDRRWIDVDGVLVPTLAPAATVVYIAVHTIHSGGHRLIWLKDLERLLASGAASDTEIRAVARAWNAELVLATAAVRLDGAIVGADHRRRFPAETVAGTAWLRAIAGPGFRWSPAQAQTGGGSIGRMVARSVGPTPARSVATLVSKSVAQLRGRGREDAQTARLDPGDPGSDRFPSGGEPVKRAYLETVAGAETSS